MAVKKTTMGSKAGSAPSVLTLPKSETPLEHMVREVQQAIAQHAYFLFQQRGFTHGNDVGDWLRAESDLFRAIPVEISQDDNEVKVLAEVPGYTAEEIDIRLEPAKLVIRGKTQSEQQEDKGQLSYSERETSEIFRAVHLPVLVDPENASAVVRDGILELTLPRAQNAKAKRVEVQAA